MGMDLIFYGTIEDDGTGDKNRICWIKADAMFSELYASMGVASPVVGTKYLAFRSAVSYFLVNQQNSGDLFYISKVVCGVLVEPGYYNYEVWVNRAKSLTDAGVTVVKWVYVYNHILAVGSFIGLGAAVAE